MKRYLPFLLAAVLMLTACDGGTEASSLPTELVVSGTSSETAEQQPALFPLTVCGAEIREEAKRVVSLSPAVTEIIAELGYSDRLCGISVYCDYPEELAVTTAGSAENPDMELLTGLEADVLFTLSGLSERDIYALEDAGTAVVCLETPSAAEGYGKLYSDIASVFEGELSAAEKGSAAVKALEAAAEGAFSGSYIYVTPKLTAAGENTFENAVLSLAGENLCTGEGYCGLTALEGIQPDYIIASDTLTYDDIAADETLAALVNNGAKVLYVPAVRFERPSARTAEVFGMLGEQLSSETE